MRTVAEGMERVARVAGVVGVRRLAREADLPLSTVRSYAARGWRHKYLPACDRLIEAAERLERAATDDAA